MSDLDFDIQSRPSCNVHVAHSPECLDCQRADADGLRAKLAAEKDQHHFVHRLLERARADAAKYRDQLMRFEKVDPIDWPQSSTSEEHLRQLAEARKEQIQQMRACCRALLASPNPGAPLLAELDRLRAKVNQ